MSTITLVMYYSTRTITLLCTRVRVLKKYSYYEYEYREYDYSISATRVKLHLYRFMNNTLDGRSLNILFKPYKMNFARLLILSHYMKFSGHQTLYIHRKSEFHHLIHFCHKWCSLIPRHVKGVFFDY